MIAVQAKLFRAAHMMISTEATRYYLQGVYMEPNTKQGGVIMTATDGHRLISIWDRMGEFNMPHPVIVKADKATIQACKPAKKDANHRILCVDTGYVEVVENKTGTLIVRQGPGLIDGTFPDWRRVLPLGKLTPTSASVNMEYLYSFHEAAKAIDDEHYAISIQCADDNENGPHWVRMPADSIGVIMPIGTHKTRAYDIPDPYWW